jgi:hypothetical protein
LHIYGNHHAAGTDETAHAAGKISHAAADIGNPHPGPEKGSEDPLGSMYQFSQGIVERPGHPPGTYMLVRLLRCVIHEETILPQSRSSRQPSTEARRELVRIGGLAVPDLLGVKNSHPSHQLHDVRTKFHTKLLSPGPGGISSNGHLTPSRFIKPGKLGFSWDFASARRDWQQVNLLA